MNEPDDHYICHRENDRCPWAGCPRQHDDAADPGCFLIDRLAR